MNLRPYQAKLLTDAGAAYRSGARKVLAVLPTGGGKTVAFAFFVRAANQRGHRCAVFVHRVELIDQVKAALSAINARADVLMVATYANAIKKGTAQQYDTIVFDEAHHATAATWRKIIEFNVRAWFLGVTATPARLSGAGMGDVWEVMVLGPQSAVLIKAGYLCKYKYFCPPAKVSTKGVKKTGGDYNKDELGHAANQIVGDVVTHWQKLARGKRTVVFCPNISNAEKQAGAFILCGVRTEIIHGELKHDVRKAMVDRFRRGETTVLVSVDVISEGFDLPAIEAVVLTRPTESITVYLQQVGRALRPGKEFATVIDHTMNVYTHGLPDELREWSLEKGEVRKRDKKAVLQIVSCSECFSVYRSGLIACPHCGFERAGKIRAMRVVDGELVEVTEKTIKREPPKISKDELRVIVRAASSHGDLVNRLVALGYKPGYAYVLEELYRKVYAA